MSTVLASDKQSRDFRVRKLAIHERLKEVGDAFDQIGKNLKYISENKLYLAEYHSFEDFVAKEYSKTTRWAYQKIDYVRVLANIESVNHGTEIPVERVARELSSLPDDEQAEAYVESVENAELDGRDKPTSKDVSEVVAARKNAKGGEYSAPAQDKPVKQGPDGEKMLKIGRKWLNSHLLPWINYYDLVDDCDDTLEQIEQVLTFLETFVESQNQ